MDIDFVRELELAEHGRDDESDVVNVGAALDVSAMTSGQRMTRQFFDGESAGLKMIVSL